MKAETAWKWMPAALLGATVLFAAWRIQLALGDPHFAAVENYYQEGQNWDEHMREVEASAKLGWRVRFLSVAAKAEGNQTIGFEIKDVDGVVVDEIEGAFIAFHNAYPKQRFERSLQQDETGIYRANLPLSRSGIWRWQLRLNHGADVWVGDLKEIVERTGPKSD